MKPRLLVCALGLVLLFGGIRAPRATTAAPFSQSIVVNAVDNDPDNKLWNCETNRVAFGNTETDRSRCFSFRYQVPPGGIKSAVVLIALSTLGADQDTDATIVAVGKPHTPCAWGQGKMPGCVGLHGGFQGVHKSLNINLLDIACDKSAQATPEAQRLVTEQLQTGVLHMLLQDDTAVYSAQLVLNSGAPSFQCGASTSNAPLATPAPATRTTPPALDNFNPQQFLPELNRWLTGTATPPAPNQGGAMIATIIGAGLLTLLAASNYLFSLSFFTRQPTTAPRPASLAKTGEPTTTPRPGSLADAVEPTTAPRPGSLADADEPTTKPRPGSLAEDAARTRALPEPNPLSGARASASVAAQPPSGGDDLINALGEQVVEAIPDSRDTIADGLVEQIGEVEKRRRIEAEKKRLRQIVAEKTQAHQATAAALKQVIDRGGDFVAAQHVWQQAGAELEIAKHNLAQLLKEFPDQPA